MKIKNTIIIALLLSSVAFAQDGKNDVNNFNIQPAPKFVTSLNKNILAENIATKAASDKPEELKAVNYLRYCLKNLSSNRELNNSGDDGWKVVVKLTPFADEYVNDQYYSIYCDEENRTVEIKSPGQLGLLYGAATLSKLFFNQTDSLHLHLCNITDWPDYSIRMAHSLPQPGNVSELLNFALQYKIETVAIASRKYSWFKVDDEYLQILKEIKEWKDKFGGPHVMQMHNIYEGKIINTADKNDINDLKNVISTSIKYGVDKLMILADDTPPFKYGEGYILTYDDEKAKFAHMAEAHCALMTDISNWLESNSMNSELYYVPPFYTYEDMHYGDVNLFKDTPWEDDAYVPLMRDLKYIGLNMPDDVYVIWCGPYVRSRKITVDDLNDWTFNLQGRIPFLWDNTIYSHHPFTSTPLFTAYDNDLPYDFNNRTAGSGMTINCDANTEETRAAIITTMDYLWNSAAYEPNASLKNAMENYYGEKLAEPLLKFKDTELELRKKIGERKLWFEADTLWQEIRDVRWIHTKNPFYYHFNYTQMKGLRLQLKYSVPEPVAKDEFIVKCKTLNIERQNILEEIKAIDPAVYEKIKGIISPLPDFEKLQ